MRPLYHVLRALGIAGIVILAWAMVTRITQTMDGYVILTHEWSEEDVRPVRDLEVGFQSEGMLVAWTDPSDRLLSHVYVQWTDESDTTTSRRVDAGIGSTLIRGLLPGETYRIRVTAMNTESEVSDAVRVRVQMPEPEQLLTDAP